MPAEPAGTGAGATPTGAQAPTALPASRPDTRLWGWQTPLRLPWLLLRLTLRPPLALLQVATQPLRHLRRHSSPPSSRGSSPERAPPTDPAPWLPADIAAQLLALKGQPLGTAAGQGTALQLSARGVLSAASSPQRPSLRKAASTDSIAAVHLGSRVHRPLDFREFREGTGEEGFFTPSRHPQQRSQPTAGPSPQRGRRPCSPPPPPPAKLLQHRMLARQRARPAADCRRRGLSCLRGG